MRRLPRPPHKSSYLITTGSCLKRKMPLNGLLMRRKCCASQWQAQPSRVSCLGFSSHKWLKVDGISILARQSAATILRVCTTTLWHYMKSSPPASAALKLTAMICISLPQRLEMKRMNCLASGGTSSSINLQNLPNSTIYESNALTVEHSFNRPAS